MVMDDVAPEHEPAKVQHAGQVNATALPAFTAKKQMDATGLPAFMVKKAKGQRGAAGLPAPTVPTAKGQQDTTGLPVSADLVKDPNVVKVVDHETDPIAASIDMELQTLPSVSRRLSGWLADVAANLLR